MFKYITDMLARKYRAMRNSGGGYNKAAAAPSSSTRLNRLKKNCHPSCVGTDTVFKRLPDTTQGEFIHEKRVKQFVCNGNTKVTPEDKNCSNRALIGSTISGSKKNTKVCLVTKDISVLSQGTYTETALPAKCVLNEPKKPMIHNIC